MIEIFKDIKDLEGLYQVSNFGQILSLNYRGTGKPKLLKPGNVKGYLKVSLSKDGKPKTFQIHRLVAEAFIPNPENLPEVNHKDEDKTNNFVGTPENDYKDGNLEWCTREYNINYGTIKQRLSKARSKKVLQLSISGELIREWKSIADCGRNGFNQGEVCKCCRGERKSHKGFRWEYKED